MRRSFAVLTLSLAGSAPACSLLVSTDGLSIGLPVLTEGGTLPDGASSTPDATSSDASGARFCDAHATALFCQDFDGPPVDSPTLFVKGGGTTRTTAVEGSPSPPNALVFSVPPQTADGAGYAYYQPPLALPTAITSPSTSRSSMART
jgi:hypothetical protein